MFLPSFALGSTSEVRVAAPAGAVGARLSVCDTSGSEADSRKLASNGAASAAGSRRSAACAAAAIASCRCRSHKRQHGRI